MGNIGSGLRSTMNSGNNGLASRVVRAENIVKNKSEIRISKPGTHPQGGTPKEKSETNSNDQNPNDQNCKLIHLFDFVLNI